MDDGIGAIILVISVLLISLFFFTYLIEELIVVFLLISITLVPLFAYICLVVIATKWDKYKLMKEWDEFEEIKTNVNITLDEQK
jgi:hypothetical protein